MPTNGVSCHYHPDLPRLADITETNTESTEQVLYDFQSVLDTNNALIVAK